MEFEHTPPLLAEEGLICIKDLMTGLGLSRSGVYDLLKKMDPEPEVYRVGRESYFRLNDILEHIRKSKGPIEDRVPKD